MNAVEQFYDQNVISEWERCLRHPTEFAITRKAFAEYLPKPPARVLDIGGGPGRYAIELAQQGYQVTLADLSSSALNFAAEKAREAGVSLEGLLHVNALDLSHLPAASWDIVLLMGPLYHLLEADARRQAVLQARARLKPGGLLCASFITRYAPFRDAAHQNIEWVTADPAYSHRLLTTGIHDNGDGFTNAYFAHPAEIEPLFQETGFQTIQILGVEGFVANNEQHVNLLTGTDWDLLIELNYITAKDPAMRACSDHLLYIGRLP
ncbi:MAG TPA: class I SAM-dependent methyltransferase [Anaerolineaceae bacterium]